MKIILCAAAAFAVCAAAVGAANVELKLSQPLSATLNEATCLHETPKADSPEVMCMNAGAALTLVARMQDLETFNGKDGFWYKAQFPDGGVGWVFSTFVAVAGSGEEGRGGGSSSGCGTKDKD